MVPSVLASSVSWSLQCLISALTQRGRWWTLLLGSLVQSCCGEGGTLQTNNTRVCSQCLSHTGPTLALCVCALPAHTAQALGCSARNRPRLALGCMHLPGLSCSGSGTRVVLRGADLVGPAFVHFRGPSSSGDQFGEHGCCDLLPPPSLMLGFLGVQPAHLLRWMLTAQNPKRSWLAMKPACSLVDYVSLGPRLPSSGSGCPRLSPKRDGPA